MQTETQSDVAWQSIAADTLSTVIAYAPALVAALVVLLLGWVAARLVRSLSHRMVGGANRILERLFRSGALSNARFSSAAAAVFGEVLFWVVLFLAVTIAARIAELPALSGWLNQIAAWLPNLMIGTGVIVVGHFISVVAGEQVASSARAAKASQSELLGRFAQGAVFLTGLIIGLDQIGVDVTFLVALFAVVVGAICVGFSIAFGLGARDYVSNLIGARTARQKFRPGEQIKIGDIEGEILEITQTLIALDTTDGRMLVPARSIDEHGILIVAKEARETPGNG